MSSSLLIYTILLMLILFYCLSKKKLEVALVSSCSTWNRRRMLGIIYIRCVKLVDMYTATNFTFTLCFVLPRVLLNEHCMMSLICLKLVGLCPWESLPVGGIWMIRMKTRKKKFCKKIVWNNIINLCLTEAVKEFLMRKS